MNLEQKISDYINNELLNFNNISTNDLEGKDFIDSILNRLFSRKWSRKAQTVDAKKYTEGKVKQIIKNNLPFIFCYCFGGYKHFFSESYPNPDWAEIFTIKYLMEFLLPIAQKYKNGLTLEFESEEVALSLMNNTPQSGMDSYNKIFRNLIKYIQQNTNYPINFNLVLAKDFYDKDLLIKRMYEYLPEVKQRFDNLSEDEKEKRLKRAETNIMWNGIKDLTKISEDEKRQFIYNSRVLNEAFLDIDYELRGKEYFEKENLIPLLGTFGLGAGGEAWLHIASTSSSLTDFWSGIGILEVRENRIIPKIISQKQYNLIKDSLKKIEVKNFLTNFCDNYNYILVYEGKLSF